MGCIKEAGSWRDPQISDCKPGTGLYRKQDPSQVVREDLHQPDQGAELEGGQANEEEMGSSPGQGIGRGWKSCGQEGDSVVLSGFNWIFLCN